MIPNPAPNAAAPTAAVAPAEAALTRRQAVWLVVRVGISVWVIWVVLCLAAITLLAMLFGLRPFVITSGSMSPVIGRGDIVLTVEHPTDLVLSHPTVVTFTAGQDRVVTHRISGWDRTVEKYRTKGDANPLPDPDLVQREAVLGVGRILVPRIGLVKVWFDERSYVPLLLTILVAGAATLGAQAPRLAPVGPEGAAEGSSGSRTTGPPSSDRKRRRRPWLTIAVTVATVTLALLVAWVAVASAAAFSSATAAGSSRFVAADTFGPPAGQSGTSWYLRNTLAGGDTVPQSRMPISETTSTTLPEVALPNYSVGVDTAPGRLLTTTGTTATATWSAQTVTSTVLSGTSTLNIDVQRFGGGGGRATLTATLVKVTPLGVSSTLGSDTAQTAAANPGADGPNEALVFSIPTAGTLDAGDRIELVLSVTGRPVRLRYDTTTRPAQLTLPQGITVVPPSDTVMDGASSS